MGEALIVIDVQNKYVTGPLAVPDADRLVRRINDFVRVVRSRSMLVIWVTRKVLPGRTAGPATEAASHASLYSGSEAELAAGLRPEPEDVHLVKPRQSSFYGTDLELVLRAHGVNRVLLAGVTTNICVQATAQDARARDLDVVVLSDLTGSLPVTVPGHERSADDVQAATLATIAHAIGAVCRSDEI